MITQNDVAMVMFKHCNMTKNGDRIIKQKRISLVMRDLAALANNAKEEPKKE
jgi:hypothetical protein